jgi:LmbE family N-acetylglucosaminyl deacetylase
LYDYNVRIFNERRQDILQELIGLREKINPDIIFMPSLRDIHQDHNVIANEGLRAFKFSSILAYEMPWNNLSFNTSSFVILEERHIQKKVDALKEYKSQSHRAYCNEEFIRSLARTRGVQINAQYAETFEVVRWIIK